MTHASRTLRVLLLAFAVGATEPRAMGAQEAQTVLAVPDRYPPIAADIVIVRQPGQDAILFRTATLTPGALQMALRALHEARQARPRPSAGELIPIVGFVAERLPSERRARWLSRTVGALERAQVGSLGSFGTGRLIVLEEDLGPR
ncbi:MAG: hypothetical protein AAF389_18800 [Gemmatimonadota bacterium]